jgi:hypothetical protein
MKKSRRLFLMLIPILMLGPQVLSYENDKGTGLGTRGDQLRLVGNVKVRSTPSGHVTVAIDGSISSSLQPDGLTDFTWHFVPKKNRPEYHTISMDQQNVTILFTSRRLTVMSGDNVLLNLSLEKAPKGEIANPYYTDRRRDLLGTVRIQRGISLVRYPGDSELAERLWKCGEDGGLCGANVAANTFHSLEEASGCPSGGAGSTGCSIDGCCSVDCGAGYYACCHCLDGCHCIKKTDVLE